MLCCVGRQRAVMCREVTCDVMCREVTCDVMCSEVT